MSHASYLGRTLTALLLAALVLWPLAALGSRCATAPQPRSAAAGYQPSAHMPGEESGVRISAWSDTVAPPAIQPAREAQLAPGSPVVVVLPTDSAPVPVAEIVSTRLPVRLDPRRAVPRYVFFSILLV
jgi:hypothetical protein